MHEAGVVGPVLYNAAVFSNRVIIPGQETKSDVELPGAQFETHANVVAHGYA